MNPEEIIAKINIIIRIMIKDFDNNWTDGNSRIELMEEIQELVGDLNEYYKKRF